jgi:hypothetical protein
LKDVVRGLVVNRLYVIEEGGKVLKTMAMTGVTPVGERVAQ